MPSAEHPAGTRAYTLSTAPRPRLLAPPTGPQILAGLQAFYTPEELQGRLVCVAANLKPAKLAGQPSEAMVMAAEAERPGGLAVRVLEPPGGGQGCGGRDVASGC